MATKPRAQPKAVTDIALRDNGVMPQTLQGKRELSSYLLKSQALPKHYRNAEQVLMAIQLGAEMNVAPMMAVMNVFFVDGKPSASVKMQMASARRNPDFAGLSFTVTEKEAKVTVKRKHNDVEESATLSFSLDDAKRAGLIHKSNWASYPKQMMLARAIGDALRYMFPDSVPVYQPDELGAGDDNGMDIESMKQPRMTVSVKSDYDQAIEDAEVTDSETVEKPVRRTGTKTKATTTKAKPSSARRK